MEPASHPDPLGESIGQTTQRAAQVTSLVVAAAQMGVTYRSRQAVLRAARDAQEERAVAERHRLAWQEARLRWAPALDRQWLRQAGLLQAAAAWSAAVTWAETDDSADTAMRRAEDRLRGLHPYAMAWYDRLRSEGMTPADAMTEAAPLFTRHPHAREGYPAHPRAALPSPESVSTASRSGAAASADHGGPAEPGSHGGSGQAFTSGPAPQGSGAAISGTVIGPAPAARSATARSAARAAALAAQSFPITAAGALRAGATAGTAPDRSHRNQALRQHTAGRRIVM